MKSIQYKQSVIIDGKEFVIGTSEYSECIADYQENCECELADEEIVEYIKEEV
jgi:hypothetical protein